MKHVRGSIGHMLELKTRFPHAVKMVVPMVEHRGMTVFSIDKLEEHLTTTIGRKYDRWWIKPEQPKPNVRFPYITIRFTYASDAVTAKLMEG